MDEHTHPLRIPPPGLSHHLPGASGSRPCPWLSVHCHSAPLYPPVAAPAAGEVPRGRFRGWGRPSHGTVFPMCVKFLKQSERALCSPGLMHTKFLLTVGSRPPLPPGWRGRGEFAPTGWLAARSNPYRSAFGHWNENNSKKTFMSTT